MSYGLNYERNAAQPEKDQPDYSYSGNYFCVAPGFFAEYNAEIAERTNKLYSNLNDKLW